jgi:hypothetical protein
MPALTIRQFVTITKSFLQKTNVHNRDMLYKTNPTMLYFKHSGMYSHDGVVSLTAFIDILDFEFVWSFILPLKI